MFTFYLTQAVSFFSVFFFSFLILTAPKIYPQTALQFGGTNAYVQVDNSSSLQLSQFTLETWFRRDGTGTITTTGTNGITNAVPLLAKGCQQAETPNNVNLNYFLGIDDDTDVLCGDFEEPTGPNHPIRGTTVIQNDIWYHAAFTFDGTQLKLFLNGNLEATVIPSPVVTCASENISALGIGTSIQTTGGTFGYFNGVMDEVRIWSTVRTQLEIQSNINDQLSSPMTGLVARWGLNEGMGTTVSSTAGVTLNGTITGSNYQWVGGAPFNITFPPVQPQLVSPGNGTVVSEFPTLTAFVSDNNSANLIVKFFGRLVEVGEKFTLIGFPDTQYYSSSLYGGTPAIMNSQTQWVVSNKDALNIVYCAGLGDCVEHGDQYEIEWQVFNTAMDYLEDPITTSLPDGLPYGLAVGNHDQSPIGDPTGTTTYYNQYFSASRFNGRNYYGGHYGSNNNNHFDLFSAGGMDFIAIYFEYDTSPDAAITSWAENLLQTYSSRRAIIASHWIINTGNPGSFGTQGQALYNAFRDNPNVFLMLCGHVHGEGRRTDTYNGNTIHSILSDYQGRTNGGNGWLRIMEFDPATNLINIRTYSPYLNQYEQDDDSQFSLSYDMGGVANAPFGELTSTTVGNNSNASFQWLNLEGDRTYQWYVTVEDADQNITTGPVWSFTTDAALPVELSSFSASVKGKDVILNWRTETEVNNYGFEVERSVDKDVWKKIGFVEGHGNTNSPKDYSFVDKNPVGGSWFHYRLKHVDTDGKYAYSDAVEVSIIPNEYSLYQNYPNPFNPSTTIRFSIKEDNRVDISIYSVLGEKVATIIDKQLEMGIYEVELNALNLASGVYIYKISVGKYGEDYTGIKKMMVIK